MDCVARVYVGQVTEGGLKFRACVGEVTQAQSAERLKKATEPR